MSTKKSPSLLRGGNLGIQSLQLFPFLTMLPDALFNKPATALAFSVNVLNRLKRERHVDALASRGFAGAAWSPLGRFFHLALTCAAGVAPGIRGRFLDLKPTFALLADLAPPACGWWKDSYLAQGFAVMGEGAIGIECHFGVSLSCLFLCTNYNTPHNNCQAFTYQFQANFRNSQKLVRGVL